MNIRRWAMLPLAVIGFVSSTARGGVYLTSYTFTTTNLPFIYTDESLPPPYKLRAKINGDYHATDLFNNNSTQLQSVPGPGIYPVDLYWVKYNPDGTSEVAPDVNHQTLTIQASSNSAPTIQWTSAPSEAQEGQSYDIQALGSDANGNLNQVSVWKQWSPFAFAGGGNGWSGYSEGSSIDTGGQWITYQAQAVDSSGATSPVIYHTVHINKKPTIWWEIAPNMVNYQSSYSIQARAQDADGNMTTINVYRTRDGVEAPFAFELNGTQSDAYSGNPDYSSSYSSTLYRAEAFDATGASSGFIYHTVYVANQMPVAGWSSTMPNTSTFPSGSLKISTFIGQAYSFTISGSDPNNNLQEIRTYQYAWEDVSGSWVERQNFQQFDTVASSGG
jgi:hypothetical protein